MTDKGDDPLLSKRPINLADIYKEIRTMTDKCYEHFQAREEADRKLAEKDKEIDRLMRKLSEKTEVK